MRSHHQHRPCPERPGGRVDGPGLLYGGVGLVLAVAMQLAGVFKKADAGLLGKLSGTVFRGQAPEVLGMAVPVLLAAVFCFGVAFAVLDSAGVWRRVVLGVSAVVVAVAMVPAFAVWNVYFSPFLPVVGIFWSWFCTMVYAGHHTMPCDLAGGVCISPPDARKEIPKPTGKPVPEKKKGDSSPDDKYKPPKDRKQD